MPTALLPPGWGLLCRQEASGHMGHPWPLEWGYSPHFHFPVGRGSLVLGTLAFQQMS